MAAHTPQRRTSTAHQARRAACLPSLLPLPQLLRVPRNAKALWRKIQKQEFAHKGDNMNTLALVSK
jgi:hypothetical protein